jgi:hypothetical protein
MKKYPISIDSPQKIVPTVNIVKSEKVSPSIEIISIDNGVATYILYYNSRFNPLIMESEVFIKPITEFNFVEINLICPTSWGLIIIYGYDKLPEFRNTRLESFTEDEINYLKKIRPEVFTLN